MNSNSKILWVDDEIESLKPHILYLESKGYLMKYVSSGNEAISLCKNERFDLVLLDEMMTGLDGLSTLKLIKEIDSSIPIIMITKNEEEWLMEEAIASQISNYLIKPVNPNQILIACKNILEKKDLTDNRVTKGFLSAFNEIDLRIQSCDSIGGWIRIYDELSNWSLDLEKSNNTNLMDILNELHFQANRIYGEYICKNYINLINNKNHSIPLSPDVLDQFVKPNLINDRDVVLIVIDCLKFDQWKLIKNSLAPFFTIDTKQHLSILPTATPYSRNAIFSGKYPIDIQNDFPEEWKIMHNDENSLNSYEKFLLNEYLKNNNLNNKSMHYSKLTTHMQGQKFYNRINEFKNINLLSMVVNFVDILGHSRSESNLLKEMIPDEIAYRRAINDWFKNSWLLDSLIEISKWNKTVIITSDHGSLRVKKPIKIKADKFTSSGIRYKHGKNLNIPSKIAITINDLEKYKLSKTKSNECFVIAKDDNFFLYPNNYNKYVKRFQNSFHHGGVSLDEMIVPVGILECKN